MPAARGQGYLAGLTRGTVFLALSSFFGDISTEMFYPVLPIFLTQALKAGGGVVGLVEGVAGATSNLAQGFSGPLSDRLGRRKPVALAGYALAALSKPLIGLSGAWPGVLGARFLDRLGSGVRSAPRDALVAASAAPAFRGRAFGLEGAGDNAGAFLGPVIAAGLLGLAGIAVRSIFFLAIIPGLLAFAMVLPVQERRGRDRARNKARFSLRRLPGPYFRYLVASAVFGLGNSANAFLILRVKRLGATLTETILIYAAFNLVAALVSYPAGSLSDRFGRRTLALAATLIAFFAYLGLGLTGKIAAVAGFFLLYGVFQGVFRAAGKALAADLAPDEAHASALG
ncbi:MAG TPA: MFS transporter [Caulobacteraceae bacterium]|nr:MFS transporter [Caulobacteraceae bacterium]